MSGAPQSGCCAGSDDHHLLTKDEALERLLGSARPPDGVETLDLDQALGRVLAEPVVSPIDVPPWPNSAMDGYALCSADLADGVDRLRVTQRIPAGVAGAALARGTAARIFTGAPIPAGADTVVIQERCVAEGDWVRVPHDGIIPGQHIRGAGEDVRAGTEVIPRGTRIGPQHLGLAASVGVARLTLYRRLRVAIFATGDELVPPGEPLGPGKIYNSNRFTLRGLLVALGCEVVDLGQVPDTLEATLEALRAGAQACDLVLTSGGVSVGDEDHVKPAVEQLGRLDLWRISIRPGKPLAFGAACGTPFLGSPGNPVSLFATFVIFARPYILRLQGVEGEVRARPLKVRAGFAWPRPDRRREFMRARIEPGDDGEPRVMVHATRSSGVLSSIVWADGLVEIPEGCTLAPGDWVDYLPFAALLH